MNSLPFQNIYQHIFKRMLHIVCLCKNQAIKWDKFSQDAKHKHDLSASIVVFVVVVVIITFIDINK